MSVYFARVKGYVKIGYAAKPWERVGTITTGTCIKPDDVEYGDDIDLLGWIPGDRKTEASIHAKFAHLHVTGEWFLDTDDYDDLIEADEFGVPFHMSSIAVRLMMRYPSATRAQALAAAEVQIAENRAAGLTGRFDPGFIASIEKNAQAERKAEREFWRGLTARSRRRSA